MTHPLDGAQLKLARAQEHLNSFGEESVPYINSNFGTLDFKDDRKYRHVFWVVHEQPPLRLAAILGDCVHNIRSALDHLAWQLVRANHRQPKRGTAFPTFDTQKSYGKEGGRYTEGMSAAAITLIEELQPYHRGQRARYHPLAFIRDLDQADKHRTLNLTQGCVIPLVITITTLSSKIPPESIASGIARHGAKLASFRLSDFAPHHYVQMDGQAESLITLDQTGPWGQEPAILLVGKALAYVGGEVFPRFDPFFRPKT